MNRRHFLAAGTSATLALGSAPRLFAAGPDAARNKLIGFTKPFDTLSPEETADVVSFAGWDGVELGVRRKSGHVKPERVEDDLPKMAEALKKAGKEITIATTEITAVNPLNERVLRTSAKLGIRIFRLGFFKYDKTTPFSKQLAEIRSRLRDIAALAKDLGMQAGFQNHSGSDYVGAGIWDTWSLINDLPSVGFCFDIGHATIEGGLSWPNEARLARPHFAAVYAKDFVWQKQDGQWKVDWVHFGEGMVNRSFFKWLRESDYTGPVCQHHEYDHGKGDILRQHLKRDAEVLRTWLNG